METCWQSADFLLSLAALGLVILIGWSLVRLTHAIDGTGKRIEELAAVTARHEQAVADCVATLKAGCGKHVPPRGKRP